VSSATIDEANADLDEMARALAQMSRAPSFRGFIRSEIAKSKNRENIVSLDRFLERAARQQGMPPGIAELEQTRQRVQQRFGQIDADALQGFDLYIPVEAHRAKWRGGEDFIVAFAPLGDDQAIASIKGYSVATGEPVLLRSDVAPETVVLVLAPEEHESHDVVADASGPEAPTSEPLPRPHVIGKEAKEAPVPQDPGNSYVGIRRMFIRDVREPWWAGAPEIYLSLFQRKGNYCAQTSVFHTSSALAYLDHDDTWHTTWHALTFPESNGRNCGRDVLGAAGDYACAYFNSRDYATKVRVVIYERDSIFAPRNDYVFSLFTGVTCAMARKADDDYVDSGTTYRNNFNFEFDYRQDMGNAYVFWHKVH
jgi:hypothetical protein